jgi:ABC-type multidrug transport system ATPase subunit
MADTIAVEAAAHVEVEVDPSSAGNVSAKLAQQAQVFSLGDAQKAASLSWADLSFNAKSKAILGGITGELRPGQLTCILGPSGAGKTSFMNLLAGRVRPGGKSGASVGGEVKINGNLIEPHKQSHLFGYVMQEDSLFATSSPREVLEFAAKLRLNDVSSEQVKSLVTDMLATLGLAKCADVMVGNALIKGISGGEKKRTAIGAELMTNPKITFLDEPTSGLDSSAAYNVISLLKQLTERNQSVMCTIHQPSSEIFQLFDCAIFLARGKVVYQGPPSGIREYFDKLGHKCPQDYNPADFVMHILQQVDDEGMTKLTEHWDKEVASQRLTRQVSDPIDLPPAGRRKGILTELALLTQRELRNVIRDKASLGARFGSTIFLSLLFGIVFWKVGDTTQDGYNLQSHMGGITMVGISGMFGAAQPTMLSFPSERPVFLREYSAGMYAIGPYFLSKSMVEVPLIFATSAITIAMCFPMLALQGQFILHLLSIFLVGITSASVALVTGCAISDVKTVQELAPVLFVPQILFAGFFVKLSQVPVFLRWVQYLCTLKWGMNVILSSEFADSAIGEDMLRSNDINPDESYLFFGVLIMLFFGFRSLAVLVLYKKASAVYS